MDDFSKYMTPPEEPSNRAYLQDGWLRCPYCGKKILPVKEDTIIWNLELVCKNSKCKKVIQIHTKSDRYVYMDTSTFACLFENDSGHFNRIKPINNEVI